MAHLSVSVTSAFVCNVLFSELLLCANLSVVADACFSLLCPATLKKKKKTTAFLRGLQHLITWFV